MSEGHDFSRHQVVRQELVADAESVQLTFNRGRMYINSYGLKQFPDEDFIQVMIDEDGKSLVIKPMPVKKRDSFRWCGGVNKRKPRHVKCIPLYYLLFRMMGWDIEARYRICGEIEDYGERRVIYFDLKDAVCFVRTDNADDAGNSGAWMKKMPIEWEKSFGIPVMDYEGRQDIRTFDEAVTFDVELEMKKDKVERMQDGGSGYDGDACGLEGQDSSLRSE